MKTYSIRTYSHLDDSYYQEDYSSLQDMITGLKEMLEREDNNLTLQEFNELLENKFHNDGYDLIELLESEE